MTRRCHHCDAQLLRALMRVKQERDELAQQLAALRTEATR